jgi:hypothetical protein
MVSLALKIATLDPKKVVHLSSTQHAGTKANSDTVSAYETHKFSRLRAVNDGAASMSFSDPRQNEHISCFSTRILCGEK